MTRPPRMSPRPHRGGFTLMEIMLAIALVLALVVALFAFYSNAMDVRREIAEGADWLTAERAIMDGLTNELRAAMPYQLPNMSMGIEGGGDQIGFVSAVVPGAAAWTERTAIQDPNSFAEQDIQILKYRLRVDANFDPVMILGMERVSQKTVSAISPERGQQVRLISPRVQFLNFRFCDGATWRDSWQMGASSGGGGPQLPMGVEVTLGTEPMPDNMDLETYLLTYPVYQRRIFVPAGAKPSGGGTIVLDRGVSP